MIPFLFIKEILSGEKAAEPGARPYRGGPRSRASPRPSPACEGHRGGPVGTGRGGGLWPAGGPRLGCAGPRSRRDSSPRGCCLRLTRLFPCPSRFPPADQSSDVGYLAQHQLFDQVRLSPRSAALGPDISQLPVWASSPDGRKGSSSLVGHRRGWHPRPPHRRAAVVSRKLAVLTPGPQACGAGEGGGGGHGDGRRGPSGRARSRSTCGRTRRKGPRQPGEGGRL